MAVTQAKLRELLPELPGVNLMVQDQSGGGHYSRRGGKSIAFQLVGEDSGVLSELADEARFRLREIPGVVDPWSSSQSGGMELFVDLDLDLDLDRDRELAALYGVPLNQPAAIGLLRPILMTAITTLAGLVPIVVQKLVLAEDGFALVGRGIARTWRVVTFRGRGTRAG